MWQLQSVNHVCMCTLSTHAKADKCAVQIHNEPKTTMNLTQGTRPKNKKGGLRSKLIG
jgi:hypothetical protein